MSLKQYRLIKGDFVIEGKEPDGDSVRFVPRQANAFQGLYRASKVKSSPADGSVQLRFEGIDAPETHYGGQQQPMGIRARDILLGEYFRFTNVETSGAKVISADQQSISGFILTQGMDVHGRPISFVFAGDSQANDLANVELSGELLERSANAQMLEEGNAYLLAYESLPEELRAILAGKAQQARDARRGVWSEDQSGEFRLEDFDSINEKGALIYPKLFRRSVDFLKAKAGDSSLLDIHDWLESKPEEDDEVRLIKSNVSVHFGDLIAQNNNRVSLQADLLDMVFQEK